jgi:glycosyltransferase involved in cell wall biosynthesis
MSSPAPVRVLIVHPRDPAAPTLGGIQTFLRDFIKYAPADFDISFVGTTRDERARPVGSWMTLDVYGRRIKFLAVGTNAGVPRSPAAIARSIKGLARLWRALAVHGRILQVHRPYRSFVLNHHPGPIVQFIHLDLRDWPGPQGWPKLKGLYREFSDEELERMDRVYIVNETGALMLREAHPTMADRVEFLPVWFDATIFHRTDTDERARLRAALADRLGLMATDVKKARYVLSAGRLTEIKKPLLAVETLAALNDADVHLVVAGAGELGEELAARAGELDVADRVHLLGDRPRDEIAQLMQASDALLLTARSEGGGPRVVLEALACGLPVVSTSVVEVRRTVASGINGWLVDDAAPQALARGLHWVLSQPHEELARAAAAAVESFTAEQMLDGLYAAYRALSSSSESK